MSGWKPVNFENTNCLVVILTMSDISKNKCQEVFQSPTKRAETGESHLEGNKGVVLYTREVDGRRVPGLRARPRLARHHRSEARAVPAAQRPS